MKKKRTIIIIVCVVVVVAAVAGVLIFRHRNTDVETTATDITAERRTITNTIEESGTLTANDEYSITALVSGDIISAPFEEGDVLEEGTLMYQFDSSDADRTIESAEISLENAQRSYNEAVDDLNKLTVTSSESGTVKTVNYKVGDDVQSGATIAECYNDSTMEIKVPFNAADCGSIWRGQSATLTMSDTGANVYGTVTYVDTATTALAGNMVVKYVTIDVTNPGAIKQGDTATAEINGIMCNDAGTFDYLSEFTISAEVSGTIQSLNIKEGGKVSSGQMVAVLTSTSVTNSYESAKNSLRNAEISLENANDQLDDYNITAPISGTVVTKNAKAGDTLDRENSSEALALIYDLTCLKVELAIDEVDINNVAVGQTVTITADAVDGTFTGYVDNVGVDGTSQNGVTTYPVTVVLEEYGDLLPGMNIDAVIIVSQAENVLALPVDCVNRGNTVYVKGDKTEENDNAPEGYKTVSVETGLSDDSYIEIISGISEEDLVRYASVATNSTAMTMDSSSSGFGIGGMSGNMGGGMSGGMGGGMSGGGGGGMGGGMR